MRRFKAVKDAGPWAFSPQRDKFAYINNPRWTPEMAHEDDHKPCGYWYKTWSPEVYLKPDLLPIWEPSAMAFDTERGLLYTTCVRASIGGKYFRKLFETDVATFKHVKTWGKSGPSSEELWGTIGPTSVTPYVNDYFITANIWPCKDKGDGHLIPIARGRRLDLINTRTNTIRHYNLDVNTTYEDIWDYISMFDVVCARPGIALSKVDLETNRLYLVLAAGSRYRRNLVFGYFDLEEESPPYTWHLIHWEFNQQSEAQLLGVLRCYADFFVDNTRNLLILTTPSYFSVTPGFVRVIGISTGASIGYYNQANTASFPFRGIGPAAYSNGYLYGKSIWRHNPDHSGMAIMNITNGLVEYSKPSYAPEQDHYGFTDFCYGSNNRVYVNHVNYGIGEYIPATGGWRLLNDWTLPGLHRVFYEAGLFGAFSFGMYYDDVTKCVYSGHGYTRHNWGGWEFGLQDLHWQPTGFNWRCFIARHSVVQRPPEMDHGDKMPDTIDTKVPMIWTMPSND